MKRSIVLSLLLAVALVPFVTAQTPAAPAKIAVISFQEALAATNEGQRDVADLQKKFEPKRVQFKTMAGEIDTLTRQLQSDGGKLTDEERASRAKIIDGKKKQAQRFGEDGQKDFQTEMQQVYSGLATKVYDVLTTYAKQQGYTMVLDTSESQQQAPAVLYWNPSTDITKAVVEAYNLKSGVPAPPPQPASAAPRPAAKPPAAH